MQKLPIALALASLLAVVAVAKTQRNADRAGSAIASNTVENRTHNPFPDEVSEALDAQAVPHNEATNRARAMLNERKFKEAEAECRRAMTLVSVINGKPWYGEEVQLLGDALLGQGRNREALACFLRLKTSSKPNDPRKPQPHLNAALAYCRMSNLEMARKHCPPRILAMLAAPERRADWIGTTDIQALEAILLFARASDENSMANSHGALRFLEPAAKLAPRNWRIASSMGRTLDDLKRYDEAIPYYRIVIEKQGDKARYETRMRVEMHDRRNKPQ